MKIRVKSTFSYTLDNITEHTLTPGEHDVSKEVADLAISFRAASRVVDVKQPAPENKMVSAPENKVIAEAPAKRAKKAK